MNLIKKCIDDFITYLDLEKNYSPRTIENYKRWLYRFYDFMEVVQNKKYIEQIQAMDILSFRSFLSSE